ncbi:hypothetical protein PENTCL1PPCAC_4847, partial [Pristionchus entomophagus]
RRNWSGAMVLLPDSRYLLGDLYIPIENIVGLRTSRSEKQGLTVDGSSIGGISFFRQTLAFGSPTRELTENPTEDGNGIGVWIECESLGDIEKTFSPEVIWIQG